jgi:hypothetical protein
MALSEYSSVGRTEAELLALFIAARDEWEAGKMTISIGSGETNLGFAAQASLEARMKTLYAALSTLNPTTYTPIFVSDRTTPTFRFPGV